MNKDDSFKLPYKRGSLSLEVGKIEDLEKRVHFLDLRTKELEDCLAVLTQEREDEEDYEECEGCDECEGSLSSTEEVVESLKKKLKKEK